MYLLTPMHLWLNGSYFVVENRNLKDKDEIEKAIKLGEYIRNGTSP